MSTGRYTKYLAGTSENETGYVDNTFSWIEGRRDGKWFPLYCYRIPETEKAQNVLQFIQQKQDSGLRMPDGLGEFSDFRLHLSGEWMDSTATGIEVRSIMGLKTLMQILNDFGKPPRCRERNPKSGKFCLRYKGHEGKHSPKLEE